MKCCICSGEKNLGILLKDIKNIELGYDVYCLGCVPGDRTETNEHGAAHFPMRKVSLEDLEKLPTMLNPDVSCDFCDKPDPQWLYDLKIGPLFADNGLVQEELDFGDRWTSCQACVDKVEAGETILEGPSLMMMIHAQVIQGISNKRPYVRSDKDGRIKINRV